MKKKKFFIIGILLIVIIIVICLINNRNKNKYEEYGKDKQNIENTNTENNEDNSNIASDTQENNLEETQESMELQNHEENLHDNNVSEQTVKSSVSSKVKIEDNKVNKITQDKNTNTVSTEKNNNESTKNNNAITSNDNKEKKQNVKKIDLSKYDYYKEGLNGSYIGFIENQTEIDKLKSLIDEVIAEFGYKNMKISIDKSLSKNGTPYFTANRTNVQNLIYDSEGFSIYYYAVKEYFISNDGEESYFQTRSYIDVR